MNDTKLEWRWFPFGGADAVGTWMRVSDGSGCTTDGYGRTYEEIYGEANDG